MNDATTTATQTSTPSICIADLQTRSVDWLWPSRIPVGKVTLLVGDPGVGKSLIALDIAARLSRATPWPDATPPSPLRTPHSALILSAEDGLADTIFPRLRAAGADCSLIRAIPAFRQDQSPVDVAPLDINRDLAYLHQTLCEQPGCRLLIIDPISAYVGRASDNFSSEVRRITNRLSTLAAHHQLAVLAVSHLRKQEGAAIYRALGSLGWIAAARAAWLVVKDPATPNRRVMLPLKNNLAASDTGLACTIESVHELDDSAESASPSTSRPQSDQPVIRWSPDPITATADEMLHPKRAAGRPSDERDDAVRWLKKALAAGPRPSKEIEDEALGHGIHLRTLRRAFRALRGEAKRVGYGSRGEWQWSLPAIDGQNPSVNSDNR